MLSKLRNFLRHGLAGVWKDRFVLFAHIDANARISLASTFLNFVTLNSPSKTCPQVVGPSAKVNVDNAPHYI